MNSTELWQLRFEGACERYHQGETSRDVFMAELYRLGYIGKRLEDEFAYQDNLKANKVNH